MGNSAQQQVEERTLFVAAVTFRPQESFLILCKTGERKIILGMCCLTTKPRKQSWRITENS